LNPEYWFGFATGFAPGFATGLALVGALAGAYMLGYRKATKPRRIKPTRKPQRNE